MPNVTQWDIDACKLIYSHFDIEDDYGITPEFYSLVIESLHRCRPIWRLRIDVTQRPGIDHSFTEVTFKDKSQVGLSIRKWNNIGRTQVVLVDHGEDNICVWDSKQCNYDE